MAKGVAPFSSAELFKSEGALSKPKATKSFYDSHLTHEAKVRKSSSLKGAMKYFNKDVISLCGGLPSSEYFPFEELAFEIPTSPTFVPSETKVVRGRKYDVADGKSDFDLSIALNYGQSMGPPQLMRYLTEHTEIVHAPPYSNWDICLTQGSTSALDIAFRMFCSRGDALLTEEYSFSSAIETALPMGVVPVGIKMDDKGLCAKNLERKYGGATRPKILYMVPTGGNPTGATQDLQRRRDILKVCEQYDILIIEDEPYYFLQMGPYLSRVQRNGYSNGETNGHGNGQAATHSADMDLGTFLDSLVPSYLSLSTSGNVLRMDSFSKIIAPGSRTGWVTGSADLIERFVRASEVSAQTPSGFSLMALYKLLEEEWGHEGFLRWLMNLRSEYKHRRDGIVEACETYLPRDIIAWDVPRAGMFHWLRVDGRKHPVYKAREEECKTENERKQLLLEIEEQIFVAGTRNNVLVARGSWFRAEKDNAGLVGEETDGHTEKNGYVEPGDKGLETAIYFRMTFAAAPMGQISEAVRRFGDTLREEFGTN
ncbi:Aromatic/aminoadipate aminotransferase 1 [Exophiala xenobiotica]|uniref:Aromatic/aminoadipate aminotransferase 1 n=1 Tax=Lithohypha guttulata TaxID=1690604 RepID=A0ABR0JWT3_9EURO|nr:Aromatic/aminoadipate aminotransferase 1 [Lithohypha guttulata]KAK5319275.1 Aromatic/aminoadipate aminotransferase 1 [Exophiala xenobiotica]